MQFQTNANSPQVTRRTRAILVIVIVLVGIIVGSIMIFRHRKSATDINSPSYYDKGSGETVSNPRGKSPETFGAQSSAPIFLGFDDLLSVGMTKFQLDAVKKAFDIYAKSSGDTIKEVSITVSTIKRLGPDRDTGEERDIVAFKGIMNRKQAYEAKVESQSLKVARLYLIDASGKIIFDSNDVDAGTSSRD